MSNIVVCAMYKFVTLDDYIELKPKLLSVMEANDIKGTLLLAKEGINGTVSGTRKGIDNLLAWFATDSRLKDIDYKESYDETQPFYRTKVKLKKEIVTLGVEGLDPTSVVGTYVEPEDWNALISDPDVVLIDTRNDYEVAIGTFKHAVNPDTKTFREFPEYSRQHLDKQKHKKVAMFCTGGIRCEKSTAFLKEEGFEEVYHLKGGILNYLEKVPEENSLWEGECFVFDNRTTVNHQLEKGTYDQCHACRMPITASDKASEHYVPGLSCPHCYQSTTEQQKERFAEREKQMQLAKSRGETHIGSDVSAAIAQRKQEKQARKQTQQKK